MPSGIYLRTEYHREKLRQGFRRISDDPEWREKQRSRRMGKKHSLEARVKMSIAQSGEKSHQFGKKGELHPRWIMDRTKLVKKQERNDVAYREWRRKVWLRDNYKCKMNNTDCSGRIEAHHILGWSSYPELRYEINNGITLCRFHHPRVRKEEKRLISCFQGLVSIPKEIICQ